MPNHSQLRQVLTSDDVKLDVSPAVAQQMESALNWPQNDNDNDGNAEVDPDAKDDDENVLPVSRVRSDIMKLVIKWCEAMVLIDDSLEESEKKKYHQGVIKGIFEEAHATDSIVFELIIAADYLSMENLLEAGTQYVANLINKCKTAKAFRRRFLFKSEHNGGSDDDMADDNDDDDNEGNLNVTWG